MEIKFLNNFLCVFLLMVNIGTLKAQQDFGCDQKVDTLTINMSKNSIILLTYYYVDSLDENFKIGEIVYPKVTSQSIFFSIDDIVIKEILLNNLPINKHKKLIETKTLPINEVKIFKGCDSNYYYLLYGAALCCGMKCPEYIGFFSMDGTLLYECITAYNYEFDKNFKSLEVFCHQKNIDINNPIIVKSISYKL